MSKNLTFGRPGLQYPTDIHKESVAVQKATKMIVDNLFFLHKGIDELASLTGIGGESLQQMITQTITNNFSGGGGGGGGGGTSIQIVVGTHSIRLSSYGTASLPLGSLFIETDRTAIYYISNALGPPAWVFGAGTMTGLFAGRPTDLATNDVGFLYYSTDTVTMYVWTGAAWLNATGVTSITGTANQVIASSPTGAVTLSTPQDIAPTSSPTFAGETILNTTTTSLINLDASSGFVRGLISKTGGVSRWTMSLANSNAEGGANSGSNFQLGASDDTGANIDSPIFIPRVAGGHIQLNRPVDVTGDITASNIAGSTYTPTPTNVANCSALTAYLAQYIRVGNTVAVSGLADVTPTGVGATSFRLSLPVASNFGSVIDCAGTIGINTVGSYTPKDVIADAANNEALVELVSLTGAISTISYHYIYRII